MIEIQECPSCGRSAFACGGACTHEPVPLPLADSPRFTSKLAEAIDASGRLCATMTEASDMARAVDRMVKAGDALEKAKLNLMNAGPDAEGKCALKEWGELWDAVDEVVRASKEAHAEWWVK